MPRKQKGSQRQYLTDERKRAIVDRVRSGRADGTETLKAIAEAEGVSPSNVQRWLKAFAEPRRRKVPVVGIAEQVPFAERVEGIVAGADVLGALDRYIDARIDARVKAAVADVLKRGLG